MRFGLRRRWAALGVLGAVVAGLAAPTTAAAATGDASGSSVTGPVVLLGTGGVRWTDVTDATPALENLLSTGSAGWLAVRSVRPTTCKTDGWLAVSAGARAADRSAQDGEAICRDPQLQAGEAGQSGTVTQWDRYVEQAGSDDFDAVPGLLGSTLAAAGVSTAAVGPGAAVALADESGQVPHVWEGSQNDASGSGDPQALADDVVSALDTDPELLAVDLGSVVDPDEQGYRTKYTLPELTGGYARARAEQVASIEQSLEAVLAELPADATVLVASLSDSGSRSQLRLLAATGPVPGGGSYADSLTGSSSTRQDGLAQTTDLFPTLLAGLGVTAPDSAVGSVVRPVSTGMDDEARDRKVLDLDEAAIAVNPIVQPFFIGLVVAQVLLYLVATLILRRRARSADQAQIAARRLLLLRWLRRTAVVFACVPAATYLANLLPWWRYDSPGLAVTGAVILFVIPMALIANLGPWRHSLLGPMGAVGAMTMLVLAGDVLTGSHLVLSSLMGLQPVVAGRFYGFGNPAFSVFATGALLLAVAVADSLVRRRRLRIAAVAVALVGLLATAIDGTPGLGSDFGGPPAIIPAFAVLALLALGVRISWRRALIIAAGTVVAIVLISVLDWLRGPEDRTHLGRFVQTVIDGGAFLVIKRKAEANVRILFTSYLSILLPVAAAFVVLVLSRPVSWGVRPLQLAYDRSPLLRAGLVSFGVLMLIGFGMNDSGVAIPAVAATVALPLLIAASVRALELAETDPLPVPEKTETTPEPTQG
ncbi:hypothetical protein KIH74_19560 [Kineosporia sp. J2-2]|uniref:Alkaline phosphatase family protein n=1 Tax=Kineosporia corallincola TaxID=2835133 RepID=A0ABS5TJ88_9ACTN|nr:hypothetical protein [Kineosporia corallincola]MBT0771147.1 hypothetical protein [Kineosporia corallincola]